MCAVQRGDEGIGGDVIGGQLVQRHDDVGADLLLKVHAGLRAQLDDAPVAVASKHRACARACVTGKKFVGMSMTFEQHCNLCDLLLIF